MKNKIDIEFNDKFRIGADERNWILYKKIEPNEEKGIKGGNFKTLAWFAKLEYLFERLLEEELLDSEAKKLKDLSRVINEFKIAVAASSGLLEGLRK